MKSEYYFVYGTLKKGHGNHRILAGCEKVGDFETQPEFTMVDLGAFPGVYEGGNTSIKGEVYKVKDSNTAQRLDWLEGYQEGREDINLYNKKKVKVGELDAWIYIINLDRRDYSDRRIIESGVWK